MIKLEGGYVIHRDYHENWILSKDNEEIYATPCSLNEIFYAYLKCRKVDELNEMNFKLSENEARCSCCFGKSSLGDRFLETVENFIEENGV